MDSSICSNWTEGLLTPSANDDYIYKDTAFWMDIHSYITKTMVNCTVIAIVLVLNGPVLYVVMLLAVCDCR